MMCYARSGSDLLTHTLPVIVSGCCTSAQACIVIPCISEPPSQHAQSCVGIVFLTGQRILSSSFPVPQGVQGISDIITIPGLVNVDFADVKSIMCNSGTAMLGVGVSTGKNRAEEAAMVSFSKIATAINSFA